MIQYIYIIETHFTKKRIIFNLNEYKKNDRELTNTIVKYIHKLFENTRDYLSLLELKIENDIKR